MANLKDYVNKEYLFERLSGIAPLVELREFHESLPKSIFLSMTIGLDNADSKIQINDGDLISKLLDDPEAKERFSYYVSNFKELLDDMVDSYLSDKETQIVVGEEDNIHILPSSANYARLLKIKEHLIRYFGFEDYINSYWTKIQKRKDPLVAELRDSSEDGKVWTYVNNVTES